MSTTSPTAATSYVLALADDALVASQRLAGWISRAPELEEDVALANIALDLLGQARGLLTRAGELEGRGRDEDDLAYFRDERDFHNVCLVERPLPDFAVVVTRMLVLSAWQSCLYARLTTSADSGLAAISQKAVKEVAYHFRHARSWTVRLGDGTEESHRRMQQALETEWPWTEELFTSGWVDLGLLEDGTAADPAGLRQEVQQLLHPTFEEATLTVPDPDQHPPRRSTGRLGLHTEHLGYLLAEMQHLARSHPGARW